MEEMMNNLKSTTKINCSTCGCEMKRIKTFKIKSNTMEEAKMEAEIEITEWKKSLENQDCKICKSIKQDLK
jgi:hypothetical protein